MPKQSSPDDKKSATAQPNAASMKEPAEGSRDHLNVGEGTGGGITNRSIEKERQEQDQLPPRGSSKDGSHA